MDKPEEFVSQADRLAQLDLEFENHLKDRAAHQLGTFAAAGSEGDYMMWDGPDDIEPPFRITPEQRLAVQMNARFVEIPETESE